MTTAAENLLAGMKSALNAPSVVKMALANLRASVQDRIIVAVEGKGDVAAYQSWFQRIQGNAKCVFLVCGNKDKVLALRESLYRDKNNLLNGVYFVIDRDFDDLKGRLPCERLYMTDRYSIENYFTDRETIECFLNVEFDLNGAQECIGNALKLYDSALNSFLQVKES